MEGISVILHEADQDDPPSTELTMFQPEIPYALTIFTNVFFALHVASVRLRDVVNDPEGRSSLEMYAQGQKAKLKSHTAANFTQVLPMRLALMQTKIAQSKY